MAKRKIELTQEEILAWADGLAGVSPKETAAKLGVSDETIRRWRNKVRDWVAEGVDINAFRLPLYGAYPLMVRSLLANLNKHDVTMTIAAMKGLGLFVDKGQLDLGQKLSDEDFDRLLEEIETERAQSATGDKEADSGLSDREKETEA